MINFVIIVLVILALIAVIWGRPTAQGCAGLIVRGILSTIGFCAAILLCWVFCGVLDRNGINPNQVFIGFCGVSAILLAGCSVYSSISARADAHVQAEKETWRKQRAKQIATGKQEDAKKALVAFSQFSEKTAQLVPQLRTALTNCDLYGAHTAFVRIGDYCGTAGVEWKRGEAGLITYSVGSGANPPVNDTCVLLVTDEERNELLRRAVSAVEAVRQGGDDNQTAIALIAISGFRLLFPGVDEPAVQHLTKYLHSVASDIDATDTVRVGALLGLGLFVVEVIVENPVGKTEVYDDHEAIERIIEYLADPANEIRKAAVFALRLRLAYLQHVFLYFSRLTSTTEDVNEKDQFAHARQIHADQLGRLQAQISRKLIAQVSDPDELVRCEVAATLQGLDSPDSRAALRERAHNPAESQPVRSAATEALRQSGDAVLPDDKDRENPLLDAVFSYLQSYATRKKMQASDSVAGHTTIQNDEPALIQRQGL